MLKHIEEKIAKTLATLGKKRNRTKTHKKHNTTLKTKTMNHTVPIKKNPGVNPAVYISQTVHVEVKQ